MLTFTKATQMLQSLSKVPPSDTANTTLLQNLWNDSRRTVASIRGGNWPWLEFEKTVLCTQDVDFVYIPNDMRRVTAVRTTVGTGNQVTVYLPKLIYDEQRWNYILALRLGSNQYPYFVFQRGQKLLMNPIPSVTDTPVILTGRRHTRDVNIADYTTGSIVSIANGATTVTGTGTSWTSGMAGQYINIPQTDAANGGDGYWYEIASITSTTVLELVKKYEGVSISGATASYTIGQITYEPEAYQLAPIYRALAIFSQTNSPLENNVMAKQWWMLYDGGQEMGLSPTPGGLIGQMLEEAGETFDGHYISPNNSLLGGGPSNPPYWFPWDLGTGFN